MASQTFNTFRRTNSWVQDKLDEIPRGKKSKLFYRALAEHFIRQEKGQASLDRSCDLMNQIRRELNRMAVNMNQIARRSNSQGEASKNDYEAAVKDFRAAMEGVEKVLDYWEV